MSEINSKVFTFNFTGDRQDI